MSELERGGVLAKSNKERQNTQTMAENGDRAVSTH